MTGGLESYGRLIPFDGSATIEEQTAKFKMIQFTDTDVLLPLGNGQVHEDWLTSRGLTVKTFLFTDGTNNRQDRIVYRFDPTQSTEAIHFKLRWA
jgi:hypothetical protein